MTTPDHAAAVSRHYGQPGLLDRILAALQRDGKDTGTLTPEDLAPIDQFHIGGRPATLDLARLAGLQPGMRVLDAGGGIGGPARTLAAEFGCHVTVLDLTEEFCRTGEALTARTGLADRVTFRHGSALAIPFPDASFDVAWTQHSTMNIQDKGRLYAELHRVVRPGGRLALHEIMAGATQPVHFPVPWAEEPAISFLLPAAQMRALIAAAGFAELAWLDTADAALEFFRRRAAAPAADVPALGLELLIGPRTAERMGNVRRNLEEGRIAVVQAMFERP
jgi:SAM-dependent methyltransferase